MVCFVDDDIISEGFSVSEEIFLLDSKHSEEESIVFYLFCSGVVTYTGYKETRNSVRSTCQCSSNKSEIHGNLYLNQCRPQGLGSKIQTGGSICQP